MAKKLSYQDVKSFIESFDGYFLISKNYINNQQKLEIQCPNGHIFKMAFSIFKQSHRCAKCSGNSKLTYEDVLSYFISAGYILLEEIYKNSSTKMKYKCLVHHDSIQSITLSNLKSGHGCKYCFSERLSNLRKLSEDIVFSAFESKGLLIEPNQKYVNARVPIKYRCPHHPEIIQRISYDNLSNDHGCKPCYYQRNSGINNCNWKGGITQLNNHLRYLLDDWKKKSLQSNGHRCVVTGKTSQFLEVHHLYSFNKIVKECIEEFQIPVHQDIGSYMREDLEKLDQLFMERHRELLGVPLLPDIHDEFHSIYGFDNTPEQFDEFKLYYLNNGIVHLSS